MEKLICLFFLFPVFLLGCEKDKLPDLVQNPLEENSGKEVVIIDSLYYNTSIVKVVCNFHIDYSLMEDSTLVSNVQVFRNGVYYGFLPKYFATYYDHKVSSKETYTYQLALKDVKGNLTKLSQPAEVTIP